MTDSAEASASTVVYRERISIADLRSDHFSGQLVERVGWAVDDASELERNDRRVDHIAARRRTGHRGASAAA
ncbi:MAG TPA: hypothetical protein VH268_12120 [Solirubrobacterales bacterium]|nr:hypothetical protein [Solirubrobacterales bacterium]